MENNFTHLYNFNIAMSCQLWAIAQPLRDNFGINFLSYRRFNKTGDLIYLINNQNWMTFSFDKMWVTSETFSKRFPLLSSQGFLNYIWSQSAIDNDIIYKGMYDLHIHNGINMYKSYEDAIETYSFCSKNDPHIVRDLYLNNLWILDRFILYFRERIIPILKKMDKSCILKHDVFNNCFNPPDSIVQNFLEQTPYKRFYLRSLGKEYFLSKKEEECLSLLSTGKSIKEAGRILNLSSRTIESHINNAKIKMDIPTTSKLINIFLEEKQKYQIRTRS